MMLEHFLKIIFSKKNVEMLPCGTADDLPSVTNGHFLKVVGTAAS